MLMFKTTFVTCGLLFCLILKIHGFSELKPFTKQWTANYTYSPNVVKVKENLLVVGLRNNTVFVNSTFNGNQSNTCKLDFLQPDDIAGGKIRVNVLGNGKIIINTVVIKESHIKEPRNVLSPPAWRLLLILYPFDCSSLKKVELHRTANEEHEALVPYFDSFDVFYYSKQIDSAKVTKSPQRYNDQGEQLEPEYLFAFENEYIVRNFQTLKPYDASEGFIGYIESSTESVVRLFNSHFERITEIAADNFISTLSTADKGKIDFCYSTTKPYNSSEYTKEEGSEHVVCVFISGAGFMRHEYTQELPKPVEPKRVYNTILTNIPGTDGVMVTVVYRYRRGTDGYPMKIYAYYMDPVTVIRKPVEIFARPIFYQDVAETFSMGTGEVCFVNGGEMEPYKPFQGIRNSIWIDCVDPRNW